MSIADTYLMYVDESGDELSTFYTAVLIPIPLWTSYLDTWLKFRRWLYRAHNVPARFELHAYTWLNAKDGGDVDRPAPVPSVPSAPINTSKSLRRGVAVRALKAIRSMNSLATVTCETAGTDPTEAYRALILSVDKQLLERDAWAVVAYDGDPGNPPPHVHRTHRDLEITTRRIVEDGWPQPAHSSQFIQIADLVSHCVYQAHRRKPARQFMWDWFGDYLHDMEWECVCPQ